MQLAHQDPDVVCEIDFGQKFGLVEQLVDERHGVEAALAVGQNLARCRVDGASGLHAEQAIDELEVVLGPVVDFLQQHLLLPEVCSDLFLHLAALLPHPGFAQCLLHRGGQPRQPVFQQVIVCSRFHGIDGSTLSDLAGYDDEGQVQARFLQQLQRRQTAELRHDVVRQNNVPCLSVECSLQGLGGLYPFVRGVIPSPSQLAQHQPRVVFRILDDQNPKRFVHLTFSLGW